MIFLCSQVIDNEDDRVREATFTAVDGSDASLIIRYALPTEQERPLVGQRYTINALDDFDGTTLEKA